jgi:uncharacterized DUF497 family protein
MYNLRIGNLDFEWDDGKNEENIRKHGISFFEAADAFRDEHSLLYFDEAHSEDEERFYLIGTSSRLTTLIVFHCYRFDGSSTRIISARKATTNEKKEYEGRHAG